ncbi:GrpB family protein [Photobacterium arenosum]|uniref:GrpB family protein n=1 Tax=Photobacterium arenosum TaxID=2774143 RepID=UPI00288A4D72|nr:GrpB family protein [Photobacterium arenosum]
MKFLSPDQYQKACHERFDYYLNQIRRLLPAARVEHVGASSVPGAISKGDLDILIGVDAHELEDSARILLTLGFQEKRNTLRTAELCMLESTSEGVAFQVVAIGSEFECFVDFRDRLRASPDLVVQYNVLKKSCEGLSHDEYREKKSTFIEHVLAQV